MLMYTLIAYAFKAENEYLRDSILTVLYDKDKEQFLDCFKKSEKVHKKGWKVPILKDFKVYL